MHVMLFQNTTTTYYSYIERNGNSWRKTRRLSQDPPCPRAYDVDNINRVRLRRVHRAISSLSFVNRIERRGLEDFLHQLGHLNTVCLQLRRARAQGIIPQLADSCLNVVKEAVRSLAISNVKCDRADLLAPLLSGSAVAEGGPGGCNAEAFDGAVLGKEMKNINCGTKVANNKEHRWSGRGGKFVYETGKHDYVS